MRGRPANLDTIAVNLMAGSCLNQLEVSRVVGSVCEVVTVGRDMGRVKVLSHDKVALTIAPLQHALVTPKFRETENGMPYQGMVEMNGDLIPFYGSQASYMKLRAMSC